MVKMKRIFNVAFIVLVFGMSCLQAKVGLLSVADPSELFEKSDSTESRTPLPYPDVDQSTVIWSKTIWEIVDLLQPANNHLYYPTDISMTDSDRPSLFHVLVEAIKSGKIEHVYADSYFKTKKTWEEVQESMTKVDTLDLGIEQMNSGLPVSPEYIDRRIIKPADILQYRVRGVFYFDKIQSRMMWRVIGIAPVSRDVYFIDSEKGRGGGDLVELFWVFYPSEDVRKVLFDAKVFNETNSSKDISFDDVFMRRLYDAMIYKYYNAYQDREISTYAGGESIRAIEESEKIYEEIRDFDQSMWVQ